MAVYREIDGDIIREYKLEQEPIVYKQTDKQLMEMVPTKEYGKTLFLDGELQYAEKDEYIYHEMLVHPCLASTYTIHDICVIGGGDGCAVREILKWHDNKVKEINKIDVIDYDEELTDYFKRECKEHNENSLSNFRVTIENEDIQNLIEEERNYDVIIVDLTDPDFSKYYHDNLWSTILTLAKKWISPAGSIVINAGGITPWNTDTVSTLIELVQETFDWTIHIYKVFVPSFGREWCYLFLQQTERLEMREVPFELKYYNKYTWRQAYRDGWTACPKINLNLNISHQLEEEDDG